MPSVPTLFSIAIAQYQPTELDDMINEMDRWGYDIRFVIQQDLNRYNTTITTMHHQNRRLDGWPGYPQRIAFYTIEAESRERNLDPRWLRR